MSRSAELYAMPALLEIYVATRHYKMETADICRASRISLKMLLSFGKFQDNILDHEHGPDHAASNQ